MNVSPVRTRFAPSPTGYMHIGGMRTALFNWLWARHHGGQFILRIDDTDQDRNIDAALEPILSAFRWLGLDWDEGPDIGGPFGPYFQSQRSQLYTQACEDLLQRGLAYRDFDPPELSQQDREQAERKKRPYLNVRRSLELSPSEIEEKLAQRAPYGIRFLVDRTRQVSIRDHIRGEVTWDCGLMADPVILRSSGAPLYNFATVVDDIQLQISHVIRAEEHLSNTPAQVLLFEALGAQSPEFAHIPFVAAPGTKEKLSKREKKIEKYRKSPQFKKLFDIADAVLPKLGKAGGETLNPVMVAFYEEVGFLPAAVLNTLARLGWSYDDKTEFMSLEFITQNFGLDRVVKAPAGLDPDKLLSFQEQWMSQLSVAEKVEGCWPYLVQAGLATDREKLEPYLVRVMEVLQDRLKIFSDILSYDEFFVADESLEFDPKAFQKRIVQSDRAQLLLKNYRDVLSTAESFASASLEAAFKQWMEAQGITFGEIIHALRIAVTGKPSGAGMFETLELLGRERTLARIDRALKIADNLPGA